MTISASPSEMSPSELLLSSSLVTIKIFLLSDSWINKIGEISRVSNTRIYNIDLEITKVSDSAILRPSFNIIEPTSESIIKRAAINTKQINSFSRIENTYKNTAFSDSTVFNPGYGHITISSNERIVDEGTIVVPPVYSDTVIKYFGIEVLSSEPTFNEFRSDTFIILNIDIPKLSDTTIFRSEYGLIESLSDTAIFQAGYNDFVKLSDTVIYVGDNETTTLSDTVIKRYAGYRYPLQRQLVISNTHMLTLYTINKSSYSFIEYIIDITKLSDTLIVHKPIIDTTSDTAIVDDNSLSISSRTRIENTLEVTIVSNSAIFRIDYGLINISSDTKIHREPVIDIISDSRIRISIEMSGKLSDTYIINEGTLINKQTNTAIFKSGINILIKSRTIIFIEGYNDKQILSDSRIKLVVNKTMLSDTSMRRDRSNLRAIFRKGRQL